MKFIWFFTLLTNLTINIPVSQAQGIVSQFPSKVEEVTLYTSGAQITRTSNVQLNAGEHTIHLTGFPTQLDARALRIQFADSAINVGQISTQELNFADARDPEIQQLKTNIKALDKKIRVQQDTAKSATLQLTFLESLAQGYGKQAWAGSAQGRADTAGWQQALSLMQNGSGKAYEILRQTDDTLNDLQAQRRALQNTLSQKNDDPKATTSVVITLNTPTAVNTNVAVQYPQQDAGWAPAYDARLDTQSGKLVLSQKGVVEQYTEEEWSNIKLTLSTSRPTDEAQVPEVLSQFYTLAPEVKRPQLRAHSASVARSDYPLLEEVVVTAAKTRQWSGNYSLSFPVPGRISVSNDSDQTQRFDIQNFEFDSHLVTQIAPVQSKQAFLAARFTHQGSTPLYSSDMSIFVDGTFSGTAFMPTILPGKEITLPMGQDPRIEVRLIDLAARNAETGFLKKQNVNATDHEYEIINRRPAAADIEVRAAFPVSKHKSVKVNIGNDTTPPSLQNAEDEAGVALWRKQLASNESWKIRYQATITYPSDKQLRRTYD